MKTCENCETVFINEHITNCPSCNISQGDYTDVFRVSGQELKDIPYGEMSGTYQYCNHCDLYLKSDRPTCPICNRTTLLKNVNSTPVIVDEEGSVNEVVGIAFVGGVILGSIITFMLSDSSQESKAKRVLFGGKIKNSLIASNILKGIEDIVGMDGVQSFTVKRISKALSELDDSIKNIKNVSPRTSTFITSGRMALVDLSNVLLDMDYPMSKMIINHFIKEMKTLN